MATWRPEAALVADHNTAGPHALRGWIELVTFLGPITRLDVLLEGDDEPVLVDLV